jgi:hypothetical protein
VCNEADRRFGPLGWSTVAVVFTVDDGGSEMVRVSNPRTEAEADPPGPAAIPVTSAS